MVPVLCVGETKDDREAGKREYRIKKQIMKAFENLDLRGGEVVVAYEPVWAISKAGLGEPCNPVEAAQSHELIKTELKQYTGQAIPIIYGGSVDAKNAVSYISHDIIDGLLVGNASTKRETFSPLLRAVEEHLQS